MSTEQAKTPEQLREQLIDLLKHHDWFYGYSDDYREYSAGSACRKRIHDLIPLVPDGEALYVQYRPETAS